MELARGLPAVMAAKDHINSLPFLVTISINGPTLPINKNRETRGREQKFGP
jgi:hypothetical protein